LKANPFVIPENYFENFSGKMMVKAGISESSGSINLSIKHKSIAPLWYSAAASFLLILASGWYLYNTNQMNNRNDLYYASIANAIGEYSENTITAYLDDYQILEIDQNSESLLYELEESAILESETTTLK
ncbi:MAG: hypothetical protein RBR35_17230, partial [Salinivirgaceae bacterium]|nr:hypothetical protein [Salinivirgaceae bacterium]